VSGLAEPRDILVYRPILDLRSSPSPDSPWLRELGIGHRNRKSGLESLSVHSILRAVGVDETPQGFTEDQIKHPVGTTKHVEYFESSS
jgi:hypothetical protein